MSDDLRALRELAEAATPGPWQTGLGRVVWASVPSATGYELVVDGCEHENGAFIAAANPTAVLALLDRLEAAEKRAEENGYLALALDQKLERVRALIDDPRTKSAGIEKRAFAKAIRAALDAD